MREQQPQKSGAEDARKKIPKPPLFRKPSFLSAFFGKKKEIPPGLWTKCPSCSELLYEKQLNENLRVCPKCSYHFPISATERIQLLVDPGTFEEMDRFLESIDILGFEAVHSYKDRLQKYQQSTGLRDAILTGTAQLGGKKIALGVMDFGFLGGSMGSVVGEKVTRLIERSIQERLPLIIISASGGARMYEGLFSLMQMAKTACALAYLVEARVPYISVLTHPTTAGVMASYASLGDLIIAEPKAMIGFAGPRVIKETTQATLPPGFQTAEFLLEHGLIDQIIPRHQLRQKLILFLEYLKPRTPRTPRKLPLV